MSDLPDFKVINSVGKGKPRRRIYDELDLQTWFSSEAYSNIQLMVARLAKSVEGKLVEDPCKETEATKKLVLFLGELEADIDSIPLQDTPQRFGNRAFKDFVSLASEKSAKFQREIIKDQQDIFEEVDRHFVSSFGSPLRIDYGTGHELSFLCYMLILRVAGVFDASVETALVTRVFVAYLRVVRKCQLVYKLEPAGSKGVWGLDDHQFLSYLWGASQLKEHKLWSPSIILKRPAESEASSYLLLASIAHVYSLKTGPFMEHSPILHTIATTVPHFTKMEQGLLKMYAAEVLGKFPVVQHIYFVENGVLSWSDADGNELPSTGDDQPESEQSDTRTQRLQHLNDIQLTGYPPLDQVSIKKYQTPNLAESKVSGMSMSSFPKTSFVPSEQQVQYQPPGLFRGRVQNEGGKTVGMDGGAAARSSPFGVLPSVNRNNGNHAKRPWE